MRLFFGLTLFAAVVGFWYSFYILPVEAEQADVSSSAVFRVVKVAYPHEMRLTVVCFDSGKMDLRILSQPPPQKEAKSISDVLSFTQALAGVNGGYFNPFSFQPAGLEVASGITTGTLVSDNPLEGSLAVKDGRLVLLPSTEMRETKNVSQMVQCNPMLVRSGAQVKGLSNEDSPELPRTFVATDGAGKWAIGVCRVATLDQLAEILASQKAIPGMHVDRALCLDGGPSSGLWCRDAAGQVHYEKEGTRVRNIIAIFPRR